MIQLNIDLKEPVYTRKRRGIRHWCHLSRLQKCIFDSVPLKRLVEKLYIWLHTKVITWIGNFLHKRQMRVRESFFADVNSRSRSLLAIAIPSACLSSVVCDVDAPYSGGWNFRQFFSTYDSQGTLVFWCPNSLVGDASFPLKFAFKVTHPLSNSEISTNIDS